MLVGCLVDTDHRCGAHEVLTEGAFGGCLCAANAVPNAAHDGCLPCGSNELATNGACECVAGTARISADAGCQASQLGSACSATQPCSGDAPFCAPGGYCTRSTCSGTSDCPAQYGCEIGASPSYCSRPPVGQGAVCDPAKDSADCTGAADYCAMGSCVVSGCAATTTCHGDWVCCDFRQFGLRDICVAPAALSDGKCPGTNAAPVVR